MLSIIVPAFNEEEVIVACHERLDAVLRGMGMPYEIVYIDDGSRDNTLQLLHEIQKGNPCVKVLGFARNFGHQIAVTAGLDAISGDAAVILDADMQDPPELIPDMVALWQQGYDVVYGQRKSRPGESAFKLITAKLYYKTLNLLAGWEIPRDTGDFRLVSRRAIDALRSMGEHDRFLRGMWAWVGFEQIAMPYERQERFAGKTKYSLKKMLRLAANGIFSFSSRPLTAIGITGVALIALGFAALVLLAVLGIFGINIATWLIVLAGNAVFTGLVLTALGIMGAYLSRIYDESKNRPLYILSRKWGFENEESVKEEK